MTESAVDDARLRRAVRRGLIVLTLINLFNYVDRYVVAALVETLKTPLGLSLSDAQTGLLSTGFILVYMLTSGLFGVLGDRRSRPRMIAIGVAVWSVATALGGLTSGFVSLLAARALVGVGEGTYGTIAPGLLADYYPRAQRGRVFSIFFAAIPIGAALGFVLGGWADTAFGWRSAFYIAGLPGLALAALALTLPDPPRGSQDDAADGHGAAPIGKGGFSAYAPLLRNPGYLWAVAGYAAATFAAGGLAYWMPAFLERVRGATRHEATMQFGGVTVVTGLIGTYAGGVLGDRLLRRTRHAYIWFSGVSTLAAVPFVWLALTLPSPSLYLPAIVVGELLLFASTGPINSAIVNSVPAAHRAAAVALSILAIHLFGDVPSPPLIGWISDASSLGRAVLIVPAAIAAAGVIWTVAALRAERADRAAGTTS
jgi:MFS transporter, Spinster family, sphingosine-1-phosphate transporter